jgi:hypothetical protein
MIDAILQKAIVNIESCKHLAEKSKMLKEDFKDVFGAIPHINKLLTDITCGLCLQDATKQIKSRSYSNQQIWHS